MFNKQLEAFEKFKAIKVGALFMQMGTGKTRIAIELVNYNKVDYLLYVCPFSTKDNIDREVNKWGISCEYDIVGYESIQSSSKIYLECMRKLEGKRAFIIADESIFIKNENTNRFDRLIQLRKDCEYALILNGTPLTKNEWDIYNQMFFLSPLILNMNRADFLKTFFTEVRYKKKGQKKEKTFHKFSKVNAEYLYKMIEPYIFKADLEFNQKEEEETIYIPYTYTEYAEAKEQALEEIKAGIKDDAYLIRLLTKLNYIASVYDVKSEQIAKYIKGRQVIVFCTYLEEIRQVSNLVDSYIITGDTKGRQGIIDRFKNDNKPLLMTLGVGSYSLNLQFCNEIVYSSINFDYGLIEQSKYRIKRIGQERSIKYTYFLTDVKITQLVLENNAKKRTLKNLIEQKIKNKKQEEVINELC